METIAWSKVLQSIKEDKDINFIAEVITPLHVLGVEALIMHLEEKGVKCRGYILAVEHSSSGLALSDNAFHPSHYSSVEHYILDYDEKNSKSLFGFYSKLKKSKNSGNVLYYASPFRPSIDKIPQVMEIRPTDSLKAIVTEEGTASYLTNPYAFEKCKAIGWRIRDYVRFVWQGMIRNRYYEYTLIKSGQFERFNLLDKKNGRYIRNESVAKQFRRLLAVDSVPDDYAVYENSVVILPSLLYEAGIMTERADLKIYKEIRETLEGDTFVVKPHPREATPEAYNILNCIIEKGSKVSAEEIFASLTKKPKCVIGDTGTALVNISVLFGIKTIAINKLIDRNILCQQNYFDGYNKTFGEVVLIPKSRDELNEILKEL